MAQNVEWDSDTSRVFPVACMLGNLESPSHWRLSLAFRSALYSDVNGQYMSPPLRSPSLYPCSWLHVNLCFCTQSPSCPLTLLIGPAEVLGGETLYHPPLETGVRVWKASINDHELIYHRSQHPNILYMTGTVLIY